MGVSSASKRTPEQDRQLDAERAVLGSLLIDPDLAPQLLTAVTDEDFITDANRKIFTAARSLYRSGKPVDAFTIRNVVGEEYSEYLAQLMAVTPTSANWREYAGIMHQQATLARVRELADRVAESSTLDAARPAIADMEQLVSGSVQLDKASMGDMMESFLDFLDDDSPPPEFIKTGFPWLDEGIFIRPGSYIILGGEPSSGKTAMALNMAYAMSAHRKVGFFSLETDTEQVRDRLISAAARVNMGKVQHRNLNDADCAAVAQIHQEFAARQLTTIRAAGMSADEISAVSTAMGFDIIIVDYVQLIRPFDIRRNRSEQMAAVSMALHTFAQRTRTTVLALAQLSRPEKDKTKWRSPNMHDIKESGQFEADADLILLLYEPPSKEDRTSDRVLRVDKNKQGKRGTFQLTFDGSIQTFIRRDGGNLAQNDYIDQGKKAKAAPRNMPGQIRMETDQRTIDEVNELFPADQGGF